MSCNELMASHKAPRLYDRTKFKKNVAVVTVLLLKSIIEMNELKLSLSPGGNYGGKLIMTVELSTSYLESAALTN
jgi:hypothetical protein